MMPITIKFFFGKSHHKCFKLLKLLEVIFDNSINVYLAFLLEQTDAQNHLINEQF